MVSRAPEDLSPIPAEKAHDLGDFAEFLGAKVLPAALADRLIDLSETPVDYRFLIGRVPTREQAIQIMARIQEREEELSRELASILGTRRFDDGE